MTPHLWVAAQQKAEQLAGTKRRRSFPSPHRGELGLTIAEWVDVLRAANRSRRVFAALTALVVAGWALAAALALKGPPVQVTEGEKTNAGLQNDVR